MTFNVAILILPFNFCINSRLEYALKRKKKFEIKSLGQCQDRKGVYSWFSNTFQLQYMLQVNVTILFYGN